jgi:hypothetical protein
VDDSPARSDSDRDACSAPVRAGVLCPFCGTTLPDDPDAYYHRKECQRRDVARRIEAQGSTPALRAELERASYVGD